MTDLATTQPMERARCSEHKTFEAACERCLRANRPDRKGAPPLEPGELHRQIDRIVEAARAIDSLYDEMYDIAKGRLVVGDSGPSGTKLEYDNLGDQRIREKLMEVSDMIAGERTRTGNSVGTLSLIAGAHSKIDQAAEMVDKRHTLSDPLQVVGDQLATPAELLESMKRRLRKVRADDDCRHGREARQLTKDIGVLQRQINRDVQARKAAEARQQGATQSKSRLKRSRHGRNGYES